MSKRKKSQIKNSLRVFQGCNKLSDKSSVCFCVIDAFLLLFPGGRYVRVWDLLKGGQPLVSLKNHHKTVTCLALSKNGQRLLSGSLDRYSSWKLKCDGNRIRLFVVAFEKSQQYKFSCVHTALL